MNNKTIYGIIGAIIIIIAVAVGVYALMNSGGSKNVITIENATTVQYDANVTLHDMLITYKFAGKNLGTSDLTLRVDLLGGAEGNYSYILIQGQQKGWESINSAAWTDISFNDMWTYYLPQWDGHLNAMKSWSGTGPLTYTNAEGGLVTLYNIVLNPELPASLFEPT
jgi:hypothetical protein